MQQIQTCKLDTKEAKNYAEEPKHSAEEANVILLKTKKYSERAIAKLEAQQAKAILRSIKKKLKKKIN